MNLVKPQSWQRKKRDFCELEKVCRFKFKFSPFTLAPLDAAPKRDDSIFFCAHRSFAGKEWKSISKATEVETRSDSFRLVHKAMSWRCDKNPSTLRHTSIRSYFPQVKKACRFLLFRMSRWSCSMLFAKMPVILKDIEEPPVDCTRFNSVVSRDMRRIDCADVIARNQSTGSSLSSAATDACESWRGDDNASVSYQSRRSSIHTNTQAAVSRRKQALSSSSCTRLILNSTC